MPQPIDEPVPYMDMTYAEMVKELDERGKLTEWESGFIADAVDRPSHIRTTKQLATIERIYRRRILGEDE